MSKMINAFLDKLSSLANNFEVTEEMVNLTKSFLKASKKEDSPKKSKKDSPKKDPNAPKKPTNAYMIFAKEKRAEIAESTGITESKDLVREIGRQWSAEKEKNSKIFKEFTKKLEEAKETYEEEMKSYVAPEESESPKTSPKKKSSPKKDPNAPKKPTNAYMIFAKEKRAEIAQETGLTDAKELVREIGRRWMEEKTKNSKLFKEFTKKLEEAKETYEQEMKTYAPESEEKEEVAPKKEKNVKKSKETDESEEETESVAPKKEKKKESKKKEEIDFENEDVPPPPKVEKKTKNSPKK